MSKSSIFSDAAVQESTAAAAKVVILNMNINISIFNEVFEVAPRHRVLTCNHYK